MPSSVHQAPKPGFRRPSERYTGTSSPAPLRILFLHPDETVVERCLQELRSVQVPVIGTVVSSPDQFSERLGAAMYDLVLAEYPNSICPGPETFERLQRSSRAKPIPLIFLADRLRRETAAELLSNGAADCVDAEHIGHLPVAIRRALNESRLRADRDRAEQQLRHSEAHYRALVGNLTYGMCCCDPDGTFLDVNQTLVAMLGYSSREELLAQNLAGDVLRDPSKLDRLLGDGMPTEQKDSLETEWRRKDGSVLKLRLSGRLVGSDADLAPAYELIAEDITRQRELEDRLRQQAARDSLTGLANYRHLADVLDGEIRRSSRTGREFSILLFDVDRLKQINDERGHVVGSQALCRVADAMCIFSRGIDTAARLGGDEFALVLPETSREAAQHVAQRIMDRLARDGREPRVSVSVGLAVYPADGAQIDVLLSAADRAMYAMKDHHHQVGSARAG